MQVMSLPLVLLLAVAVNGKEVTMFPLNPFNPFNPMYFGQRNGLRRVDIGGIYELRTNAQQVTEASVDFGINPNSYNALPCESIVLLKIHQGVPTASAALPVTVVVPSGSTTVNGTTSTTSGTAKTPVVDHNGTAVTGAGLANVTEALAYINKKSGIIRLLGFQQPTGG